MTGKPSKKAGRSPRCCYCGGPGVTKEHVIARSLTKLFRDEADNEDSYIRHEYFDPDSGEKRFKRAKTFAHIARKFCGTCNSGWMKDLDERAAPVLSAFATNRPVRMNAESQLNLASWATKTIFGFQLIDRWDNRFAKKPLFRDFYEERQPPHGSQLWVAANPHGHMGWFGSHSLTFGPPLSGSRGFGASLSFGFGICHFVYTGNENWKLQLKGDLALALRPVWPTAGDVEWPPDERMPSRDLTPLANGVNRWSEFVRLEDERIVAPRFLLKNIGADLK